MYQFLNDLPKARILNLETGGGMSSLTLSKRVEVMIVLSLYTHAGNPVSSNAQRSHSQNACNCQKQ